MGKNEDGKEYGERPENSTPIGKVKLNSWTSMKEEKPEKGPGNQPRLSASRKM